MVAQRAQRCVSGDRTLRLCTTAIGFLAAMVLAHGAMAAVRQGAAPKEVCLAAIPARPPSAASERRAKLSRLTELLPHCLDEPLFLAALGGLYLDHGDATQAVVWLERSLLLDPGNLGAQADFVLALAAQGQPEPLRALLARWRGRADVPSALLERMAVAADPAALYALPTVQLGVELEPDWPSVVQGEISLLAGYESNLDRSPRLSELTITVPGGELVLPVVDTERRGRAVQVNAASQWSQGLGRHWAFRLGAAANARFSSSYARTDWQQYQLGGSFHYGNAGWRAQVDTAVSWVRGPLGEPFRQQRSGLSAEHDLDRCRLRLGTELEGRTHADTASLDARYRGALLGLQCHPGEGRVAGVLLRGGRDQPDSDQRPGGRQKVKSAALILRQTFDDSSRLELSWRTSWARDSIGYSDLLENGAVRSVSLHQLSVEFTLPLPDLDVEWVTQFQASAQNSNLALFRYRAQVLYSGLRHVW